VFFSSTLAFLLVRAVSLSRVPSLHGHYSASLLLRTPPPTSRFPSTSWGRQLYEVPSASASFPGGRGGLLQLLSVSLPPCCRYHPAKVWRRFGQFAPPHAAFAQMLKAQPLEFFSRPPVRSFPLRPGDSLTALSAALSLNSRNSISLLSINQATGLLTLTPVGFLSH
jgi:hypothetical protein